MNTLVECAGKVSDIPFTAWQRSGIRCLLFDLDGTLSPYGVAEVPDDIASALVDARQLGIEAIGIVTHNHSELNIRRVQVQVGADRYFTPSRWQDRKPSPRLIELACAEFGIEHVQAGMVGDKFTADVKAAIRAGVARAAWVDRLGEGDGLGDRLLRRPYEEIFYRRRLEAAGPQHFNNSEPFLRQLSRVAVTA